MSKRRKGVSFAMLYDPVLLASETSPLSIKPSCTCASLLVCNGHQPEERATRGWNMLVHTSGCFGQKAN